MATQHLTFSGKASWAKVWPAQIDREYETPQRGGKWNITVELNDEDLKTYNALGIKITADVRARQPKVQFNRFERHAVLGEMGPPTVTGVEPGQLIGNDSDVTIGVEVYDYTYNKKPGRAVRLVSVHVDKLVVYEKPETPAKLVSVPAA